MDFSKYVEERLPGVKLLPVGMSSYLPGSILNEKTLQKIGDLSELFPELNAEEWLIDYQEASIVYGTISESRKADAGLDILGLIKIGGGVARDVNVSWEITGIRGCDLQKHSQLSLQPMVNRLRDGKHPKHSSWDMIDDQLLVIECFFASDFDIKFDRSGAAMGEVDVKRLISVDVGVKGNMSWSSDGKLVITNNNKVPFGVRGFKI